MKTSMHKLMAFLALLSMVVVFLVSPTPDNKAYAQLVCDCGGCTASGELGRCQEKAKETSNAQEKYTDDDPSSSDGFTKTEFKLQREWMVKVFFEMHILPAMMLMTEQLSAFAIHQVVVIGAFLDAKHQLETQRMFQEMMAQANKDYHPSEGMCTFGTNVRSLAAADRNMDLSAMAFSQRMQQREMMSGDALATNGTSSDFTSRLKQFREIYCNPKDNGSGLKLLCPSPQDPARMNKDIDYTTTFDAPLTLKLDFTPEGDNDHGSNKHGGTISPDEEDVLALSANLYANQLPPLIPPAYLTDENGVMNPQGAPHYMDIRAIAAKRSVARNSFAAITAMKSQGEKEVQPYMYAIMKEMGVGKDDDKEIAKYLGDRPSYYAQMEILTKKLYQNPTFYSELYDKPVNVERKDVAMQAIELMQKRDIYRSVLRSEAILSVMLETALQEQQDKVSNEARVLPETAPLIKIP